MGRYSRHPDELMGDNLLLILGERDMTQSELARISGIHPSVISGICCNTRGVSVFTVRRIKAALGCTWDELLGD